ncbi:MAG TPA: hypothetical protein VGM39_01625 [Kofleriaceae bacterium]
MRIALAVALGLTVAACEPSTTGNMFYPDGRVGDDAGGGGDDGGGSDAGMGSATTPYAIKLSESVYCPKFRSISPRVFYTDATAVEAVYDAWVTAKTGAGQPFDAPPLDVLGTRVRQGQSLDGSTTTPQQLEGKAIACIRVPSKAGPGAFETTTLTPDPTGKPVCLLEGMDFGADFHYTGGRSYQRAACTGAPTTFAWTNHNGLTDNFPTALGTDAWALGGTTYVRGVSSGPRSTTMYSQTLTATNAIGASTSNQFKYRLMTSGDVESAGGPTRHPQDSKCRIKSSGDVYDFAGGTAQEGEVFVKNGEAWAIRVMFLPPANGSAGQFEWILWGDTEFGGAMIPPYAVISDQPCEFDRIIDGCFDTSVNMSYYPGNPKFTNDFAAATANANLGYCAMKPGQIYYMNVRSNGWLGTNAADACPSGSTCSFGAYFNQP